MRTIKRDDWADLCNEAEGLFWRVVDTARGCAAVDPDRERSAMAAIFLQHLGVPGRWRMDPSSKDEGPWMARLTGGPRLYQHGTAVAGLVALAAAAGPQGPFAEEVLALATTMHALGMVQEVP